MACQILTVHYGGLGHSVRTIPACISPPLVLRRFDMSACVKRPRGEERTFARKYSNGDGALLALSVHSCFARYGEGRSDAP